MKLGLGYSHLKAIATVLFTMLLVFVYFSIVFGVIWMIIMLVNA